MSRPRWRPLAIFLVIGSLLMLVAYLVAKGDSGFSAAGFWGNAIATSAFVFLTVVLVNLLWDVLGGEPLWALVSEFRSTLAILGDSQSTGLRRLVYPSSDLWSPAEWVTRLGAAKSRVDLMGYTLHAWGKGAGFEDRVLAAVKRGVDVRVLNMDAENFHFNSVINHKIPGITPESSAGEAHGAGDLFKNISGRVAALQEHERRGSFAYRTVSEGSILGQVSRFDNQIAVIPYLYGTVASRTPILLLDRADAELFKVYEHEFETLWDMNP